MLTDHTFKGRPVILLLYSYDFEAHSNVVTAFAHYLKNVCGCDIILDTWDQDAITELGSQKWLENSLALVNFIIVICSTGARMKCARKKRFKVKHTGNMPDMFSEGIDSVMQELRNSKHAGRVFEESSRHLVVYFDYSSKSDIPPKLDSVPSFNLMTDISKLYCHLHELQLNGVSRNVEDGLPDVTELPGVSEETYSTTDMGEHLSKALEHARTYLCNNPVWLLAHHEPLSPISPSPTQNKDKQHRSSPAKSSIDSTNSTSNLLSSPSSYNEEKDQGQRSHIDDPQNQGQRSNGMNGTGVNSPKVQRQTMLSQSQINGNVNTTDLDNLHNGNGRRGSKKKSPLGPADEKKYAIKGGKHTDKKLTLMDEEVDIDDDQMKADIDFIHNFDCLRTKNGQPSLPFTVKKSSTLPSALVPPEDFVFNGQHQKPLHLMSMQTDHQFPADNVQTDFMVFDIPESLQQPQRNTATSLAL